MNAHQKLWWDQAKSDFAVLTMLRREGVPPCHQLHYLQMASEKIAKAFFWRSGSPPPRTHAGFVQFLRRLGSVPTADRQRIAGVFGFKRFDGFQNWIRVVLPMGYELERLAPALAQNGPNPEYPWPSESPEHAPVSFEFALWLQLTQTGSGRQFFQMVSWFSVNRNWWTLELAS